MEEDLLGEELGRQRAWTGIDLVAGGELWKFSPFFKPVLSHRSHEKPCSVLLILGFLTVFDTPELCDGLNSLGVRTHSWLPGRTMNYPFSHQLPAAGLAGRLLSSASCLSHSLGRPGKNQQGASLTEPPPAPQTPALVILSWARSGRPGERRSGWPRHPSCLAEYA